MSSKPTGADVNLAYPQAEIAVMGAEGDVYKRQVLEAMKMQSNYKVTSDCTVRDILVNEGDSVNANQVLIGSKFFRGRYGFL